MNWTEFDPTRRADFQRALTVSGAGSVLLQTSISKVVQLITNRQLGVQSTLPRRPGSGDKFYSNRRTAAATGGSWVADTQDDVVPQEGSYAQVGFTYRTMLGRIKVTRKLIATGRSYGDVLATELIGKSEDFVNDLESASVIGNSAADANSIDGLLTLIGNVSGQTVANTTATAGDDLYLTQLDAAIQVVRGHSNKAAMRIYCNYVGHRKINNALQAQQRFNDKTEVDGGFVVESYQGIPIIESTGIPDTLVWNGTDSRITAFTGGATTALIIVHTQYIFYSELTPWTVMPLAKRSSQYDEVDMFLDIALVLDNTKGGSILGGISTT